MKAPAFPVCFLSKGEPLISVKHWQMDFLQRAAFLFNVGDRSYKGSLIGTLFLLGLKWVLNVLAQESLEVQK